MIFGGFAPTIVEAFIHLTGDKLRAVVVAVRVRHASRIV
jgi:hypothetical protein